MKISTFSLSSIITVFFMQAAFCNDVEPPRQSLSRIECAQAVSLPLQNPSFEQSDQYVKGWGFSQHAGEPAYALSVDTSESTDGKNSFRIERKQVQAWGMINQSLPLDNAKGKFIKLSAMVKSKDLGPDGFNLNLVFQKANRKFIDKISTETITGTNNWQAIEVKGVVPAHTAYLQVTAILNDAGTAWVDDFQLSIIDEK